MKMVDFEPKMKVKIGGNFFNILLKFDQIYQNVSTVQVSDHSDHLLPFKLKICP